jgi:hypothetical protein
MQPFQKSRREKVPDTSARPKISTRKLSMAVVSAAGAAVGVAAAAAPGSAECPNSCLPNRNVYFGWQCALRGKNHAGPQRPNNISNYGYAGHRCNGSALGYACITWESQNGTVHTPYYCAGNAGYYVRSEHTGYAGYRADIVRLDASRDTTSHYMSGVSHYNVP